MRFFLRSPGPPARLAVFPGAFNPPTRAHLALAQAALAETDEVLFVVPGVFPHKPYEGADLEQRIEMLRIALAGHPRFSIATTAGGLFIDIARDCRAAYGDNLSLEFLCGRDAAERIVAWDYGRPGAFAEMLDEFGLLVAARHGEYQPPEPFRRRIRRLATAGNLDRVSASEVRRRVRSGAPWEHLAPESIVALVRKIYG